ncbi:MAG: TetR/AcrR family transcriptional regulator [Rhizobiaceae bacterium]|nr:TetR/AcrR family transcriptional regulator [Rhizobiaceae bacterium]
MRKAPRQQRSRATVDAIVEAAARILAQRGWAHFTTNEVAEAAGVSIGSLYQYFPNKLALTEAILQRHLNDILVAWSASGDWSETSTLDERVSQLIDGVIAAHSVDQALHRVLLNEVPAPPRSAYEEFETEYRKRYQALIATSSGERNRARDEVAGRMLAAAIEGVVHTAANRDEVEWEAVRIELGDLVRAYLRHRQQTA